MKLIFSAEGRPPSQDLQWEGAQATVADYGTLTIYSRLLVYFHGANKRLLDRLTANQHVAWMLTDGLRDLAPLRSLSHKRSSLPHKFRGPISKKKKKKERLGDKMRSAAQSK